MMEKSTPANQEDSAGSPDKGEPVFLVIGKLRRPHGLHGDMLMEVLTDFSDRLETGAEVYIGEEYEPRKIQRCRWHGKLIRIAFEGLDDREAVGEYRNTFVYVHSTDSPTLPEGEYYHHELIGLRVVDEDGENLGIVDQILETGANDVLLIMDDMDQEILLPFIDPVILGIDLDLGEIRVHILPGLLTE
jgi:16S rRNA processing protein RimM